MKRIKRTGLVAVMMAAILLLGAVPAQAHDEGNLFCYIFAPRCGGHEPTAGERAGGRAGRAVRQGTRWTVRRARPVFEAGALQLRAASQWDPPRVGANPHLLPGDCAKSVPKYLRGWRGCP